MLPQELLAIDRPITARRWSLQSEQRSCPTTACAQPDLEQSFAFYQETKRAFDCTSANPSVQSCAWASFALQNWAPTHNRNMPHQRHIPLNLRHP